MMIKGLIKAYEAKNLAMKMKMEETHQPPLDIVDEDQI